jgi:hypothetical protein
MYSQTAPVPSPCSSSYITIRLLHLATCLVAVMLPRSVVRNLVSRSSQESAFRSCRITPASVRMTAQRRMQSVATHIQPANYPVTHERISNPADTPNFLDNKFVPSSTTQWIDLRDPATNNLVTRVPQSTDEEMVTAVRSAETAFPAWKATSIMHKQQIILRLAYLVRENMDRLAASITLEQGKTLADARGDVRQNNLPVDDPMLKTTADSASGASWASSYRNSVRDHHSAHW